MNDFIDNLSAEQVRSIADGLVACGSVNTAAELLSLLNEATGYIESISDNTAQHIDPLAAEHLADRMNAILARVQP